MTSTYENMYSEYCWPVQLRTYKVGKKTLIYIEIFQGMHNGPKIHDYSFDKPMWA